MRIEEARSATCAAGLAASATAPASSPPAASTPADSRTSRRLGGWPCCRSLMVAPVERASRFVNASGLGNFQDQLHRRPLRWQDLLVGLQLEVLLFLHGQVRLEDRFVGDGEDGDQGAGEVGAVNL